jgi:hypothetical protein
VKRRAIAALAWLAAASLAASPPRIRPSEAPKAAPALVERFNAGSSSERVLVGFRANLPLPTLPLAVQRLRARTGPGELLLRRQFGHFREAAAEVTPQGLIAVCADPDVAWVVPDGVMRVFQQAPQAAQFLIGSDRANALGYTGAGQTIAILDTGIDATLPDFGGAPFPNARVIGGFDFVDHQAEPADCAGHGTEVAGVAAGPRGVAPGAAIVALRVFGCQGDALDSDILAGIDWILEHRAQYGIRVVNMSFGALLSPLDSAGTQPSAGPYGYCDGAPEGLPYAEPMHELRQAGVVPFASAGNAGTANQLVSPACVSSAVSVGAVYATSYGAISYLPPNACTESATFADAIACYSQSNSNLSLLAPGSFWQVSTQGGGETQSFGGTSAASPAAAGAALVAFQARPGLTADELVSELRTTGKPILDPRNGVATPRVDVAAAVEAGSASSARLAAGLPASYPDGGTASASIDVGASGTVGTLLVEASADATDPTRLRLTLAAPDGTTAILWDHEGRAGQPLNAIFGKTVSSPQLDVFRGHAANGRWTLTLQADLGAGAGRLLAFGLTLSLGGGSAGASVPRADGVLVVPLVGRVKGIQPYRTDLSVLNAGDQSASVDLYYVPLGDSGQGSASMLSRTLSAGQQLFLGDLLLQTFGETDGIGAVFVDGKGSPLLTSGRAYSLTPDGTFGIHTLSSREIDPIAIGQSASANGLASDEAFHTNLGFTEISGEPATVRIDARDPSGALLASRTQAVGPDSVFFLSFAMPALGVPTPAENLRVDFTVVSGAGRVAPYAVLVDSQTGDGIDVAARRPRPEDDDLYVLQSSLVSGRGGLYATDASVTNLSTSPTSVTISLLPAFLAGTPAADPSFPLAPGESRNFSDVLGSLFGLADPSAAGLRLRSSSGAPLLVTARTYSRAFGGTTGFFTPALPAGSALTLGKGLQIAAGLALGADRRTNFGIAEVLGQPATVRVRLRDENGNIVGVRSFSIDAHALLLGSVEDLFGQPGGASARLDFEVTGGSGGVLCAAATIDNQTQDATYVPAAAP